MRICKEENVTEGNHNHVNPLTRAELIELYKVTSEENRHWNGINMQMWMALGVVTSLLLLVVSFIFTEDFQLREPCLFVTLLKTGLVCLFAAVLTVFWFIFRRIDRVFKKCDKVCKNIEKRLQRSEDFCGLLFTVAFRPDKVPCYANHRLSVYAAVAIVAIVCFGFFLFFFIEPCHITIVP